MSVGGARGGLFPPAAPCEKPRSSCVGLGLEFRFEQSGLEFFPKSEAFSFDVDRDRMIKQAVEDRAGDHGIAEDLAPGAEALVAGDDDRTTLVAARDQLEEEISAVAIHRQVADLVANQQLRLGQQLEPLVELAFGQRVAQRSNQRRGSRAAH